MGVRILGAGIWALLKPSWGFRREPGRWEKPGVGPDFAAPKLVVLGKFSLSELVSAAKGGLGCLVHGRSRKGI